MPRILALAASVGVLAVVATWLFGLPQAAAMKLQVWAAFIAWGCHFQSGGRLAGSRATVLCMIFGAIVGMCAALAIPSLAPLGTLAAPVAVGLGATLIVLASKVPLLATIPASVYGFAAIFAVIGLGNVAPTQAIMPTAISVVIGAVFGFVSEIVANALAKKDVEATAQGQPA
jgi:hypothetical protein